MMPTAQLSGVKYSAEAGDSTKETARSPQVYYNVAKCTLANLPRRFWWQPKRRPTSLLSPPLPPLACHKCTSRQVWLNVRREEEGEAFMLYK